MAESEMVMELVRGNLGSDPKFYPATDNKPAVAYASVAENTRVRNPDGSWSDGDTHWYDARFQGKDAELIRDHYQKGDALVLVGETEKHVRETADGQVYRSERLYVKAFGPDPRLTSLQIDRSAKQGVAQAAGQQAVQEAGQEAAAVAQAAPATQAVQGAGPQVDPGRVEAITQASAVAQSAREMLGNGYQQPGYAQQGYAQQGMSYGM